MKKLRAMKGARAAIMKARTSEDCSEGIYSVRSIEMDLLVRMRRNWAVRTEMKKTMKSSCVL